jgi:hypothetical protein
MPGARCTRGLVCNMRKTNAHEHTGTAGAFRHSLRSGFTAYAEFSLETNSSCLHRRRIEGQANPGRVLLTSGGLTPATGARTTRFCRPLNPSSPRGFAGLCERRRSPGRSREQCLRLARCVRSRKTALRTSCAPGIAAATASRTYVRDDRDTPLWWDGMAGIVVLICPTARAEYFLREDWTDFGVICPSGSHTLSPSFRGVRSTNPESI